MAAHSEAPSFEVIKAASLFWGAKGGILIPPEQINSRIASNPRRISQRGQLSLYLHEWKKLTSDVNILQTIAGDCIEFISQPPNQWAYPPNSTQRDHKPLVDREISSLLDKGVIVSCAHEPGEFISPIFTVPKNDGTVRLILNLKKLNSYITNSHFKMDTIRTILGLVTPNCWMASLDLKDAYYSVRIHPNFQKYLKFTYNGTLYKYIQFFQMAYRFALENSRK